MEKVKRNMDKLLIFCSSLAFLSFSIYTFDRLSQVSLNNANPVLLFTVISGLCGILGSIVMFVNGIKKLTAIKYLIAPSILLIASQLLIGIAYLNINTQNTMTGFTYLLTMAINVSLLVLIPLSVLKKNDNLKFSTVVLLAMKYLVCIMILFTQSVQIFVPLALGTMLLLLPILLLVYEKEGD